MTFPENIRCLTVEANEYILFEMLRQIIHMLLNQLGTLRERRLVVEKGSRRLLINKRILLGHLR